MAVYCRCSEAFTGMIRRKAVLAWGLRVIRRAEVQSGSGFQPIEVVMGRGGVAGLNTPHIFSRFSGTLHLGGNSPTTWTITHYIPISVPLPPINLV